MTRFPCPGCTRTVNATIRKNAILGANGRPAPVTTAACKTCGWTLIRPGSTP